MVTEADFQNDPGYTFGKNLMASEGRKLRAKACAKGRDKSLIERLRSAIPLYELFDRPSLEMDRTNLLNRGMDEYNESSRPVMSFVRMGIEEDEAKKGSLKRNTVDFIKGFKKPVLYLAGLAAVGGALSLLFGCNKPDINEREIYNYSKTTTFVPTGRYDGYEMIARKQRKDFPRLVDTPLNRMTYHIEKLNNDIPGVNGGNGLIDGNQREIIIPDYSTPRE